MSGDYGEINTEVQHKLSKSGKRTPSVKCYDERTGTTRRKKYAQRITK